MKEGRNFAAYQIQEWVTQTNHGKDKDTVRFSKQLRSGVCMLPGVALQLLSFLFSLPVRTTLFIWWECVLLGVLFFSIEL